MHRAVCSEPEAIRRLKSSVRPECDRPGHLVDETARLQAVRSRLTEMLGLDVVSCFQIVPSFGSEDPWGRRFSAALLLDKHLPIQVELEDRLDGVMAFYISAYDVHGLGQQVMGRSSLARRARLRNINQALVVAEQEFSRLLELRQAVGGQCSPAGSNSMPEEQWLGRQLQLWGELADEFPKTAFPTTAVVEQLMALEQSRRNLRAGGRLKAG